MHLKLALHGDVFWLSQVILCRASISQQWEVAKERTLHSFAARLGWLVEAWLSSVTKPLFLERWARNRTHTPHPFRVIGLRVTDFRRAVNQAAGSRYQWEKKVIVLLSGCIYFDLQMQRPNWKLKMWFFILFKKYGCSQKSISGSKSASIVHCICQLVKAQTVCHPEHSLELFSNTHSRSCFLFFSFIGSPVRIN